MGRLDVRIVGAKNLPNTQMVSKPDPYIILKLEGQTHKTSVVENKLDPEWNEVFKFTIADPESAQLRLELWNSNTISDDFMGEYNLSVAGLTKGLVKDDWYILKQCKANSELRVRLLAKDFGFEPPPEPTPEQQPPMQQPGSPMGYPPPQGGGMPPQQQYQQPPPPPPPQQYAQPQWGAAPDQKCEVHDKKKGFGGMFSKMSSAVSGAVGVVTGGSNKDRPPTTHIDDNTGFMYLNIDNGLRLIPSGEVYKALFNADPNPEQFFHFRGPQHPNGLRTLAALPETTHLFSSGQGAIYMMDLLPPQCTVPCRRFVHESAWKHFGFGTGANMKQLSVAEAQNLAEGDPVHGPLA